MAILHYAPSNAAEKSSVFVASDQSCVCVRPLIPDAASGNPYKTTDFLFACRQLQIGQKRQSTTGSSERRGQKDKHIP